MFASRLRELRALRGLSQEALADAAGDHLVRLDGTAVTRMERGIRGVRLNEAAALANALDVDLGVLLDPTQPLLSPAEQLERAEAELDELQVVADMSAANVDTARARAHRLRERVESEERRRSSEGRRRDVVQRSDATRAQRAGRETQA